MRSTRSRATTVALACTALIAMLIVEGDFAPRPPPTRQSASATQAEPEMIETFGRLPLGFEPNGGQTDADVAFVARGIGYALALTPDAVELQPHGSDERVVLRVVGARDDARMLGEQRLPGIVSYFSGSDPDAWQTGLPTYGSVRCEDVYSGIDLVYHGNAGQLEFDFVVRPGAFAERIAVEIEGVSGTTLEDSGELLLRTETRTIRLSQPVAYQEIQGERRPVAARFAQVDPKRIAFEVGPYDRSKPLIIDPVLEYSTILAPQPWEWCHGVAVDAAGHAYVCGSGGRGLFVVKMSADGRSMVYTVIVASDGDAYGITVRPDGSAIIGGHTSLSTFPTTANAFQRQFGGEFDAFVAKIDPTGTSLEYSTFVGGAGDDRAYDLAVGTDGTTYIAGRTASSNYPTTAGALQTRSGGGYDGFLTKLNSTGSALVYSTYIGGSGEDRSHCVDVDVAGRASVAGWTESNDFPTVSAFQSARAGGRDAFAAKLDAAGKQLVFSTYLGGSASDSVERMAVDDLGDTYLSGITWSADFPTRSALQPQYGGGRDAFVTKLAADGSLAYSTFLGGSLEEYGGGVAVDAQYRVYVTGWTASPDYPVAPGASVSPQGAEDVVVSLIDADGAGLTDSMRFGGYHHDAAGSIVLGAPGVVFVSGHADSPDFPSIIQPTETQPFRHAFVAKITGFGPADSVPVIEEGPTATPSLAVVSGDVHFSVRASDADGSPLEISWDFGDGTTAQGADVVHAFGETGTHTVMVSVSDGTHTVQRDVAVAVVDAIVASQLRVKVKLDFKREQRDTLTLNGKLWLPAEFEPEGKEFAVDLGGAIHSFVLDRKGKAKPYKGTVSLRFKKKKGYWWFNMRLRKRNVADELRDEGLVDERRDDVLVDLGCRVVAGNVGSVETVRLSYTARRGKWGKAR